MVSSFFLLLAFSPPLAIGMVSGEFLLGLHVFIAKLRRRGDRFMYGVMGHNSLQQSFVIALTRPQKYFS